VPYSRSVATFFLFSYYLSSVGQARRCITWSGFIQFGINQIDLDATNTQRSLDVNLSRTILLLAARVLRNQIS
jgi:hypothetical protein